MTPEHSIELFTTPPRTYFKYGCLSLGILELLEDYSARRFQIVTDDNIVEAGIVRQVLNCLKNRTGVQYNVFQKVPTHPDVACVRQAVEVMTNFRPDVVIGVGGGGVISVAKAARVCYERGCTIEEVMDRSAKKRYGDRLFPELAKEDAKTILVGCETTAGTGASTTDAAVIRTEDGTDVTIYGPIDLQCTMAIVDCALHMSCPAKLTKVAGFAALAHAMDAFTEVNSSDYVIPFAISSIRNIMNELPKLLNKLNDVHLREALANASTMGGYTFTNSGAPGPLHYLCSAACSAGMSYGEASAIFVGPVLAHAAAKFPEIEARIKSSLLFMRIASIEDLNDRIVKLWGEELPVVPAEAVEILEKIYPTSFELSIAKDELIEILKSKTA